MVVIKFPFTSMQQFNLDWIMQQLHKMLQFMPMNGVAGDVLQRNVDGAVWMPLTSVSLDIHSMSTIPEVEGADELAIYDNSLQGNYKGTVADILALVPVSSVNGQTGAVVLSIPSDTSDLTNGAGFVDAAGAAAAAPVQSVNGQTGTVVVSDNLNFVSSNMGYYSVTGSITNTSSHFSLYVSENGKFVRFWGSFEFKTGTPDNWNFIYLYKNSNLDHIDSIVYPDNTVRRRGIGFVIDENNFIKIGNSEMSVNMAIFSNGDIRLEYYQTSTTPSGLDYKIVIPSTEICTSL